MIPMIYYVATPNVGDLVNPDLIELVTSHRTFYSFDPHKPHVLGLGSILSWATSRSVVWGSGLIHPSYGFGGLDANNVWALRGKRSWSALKAAGLKLRDFPLGDPGFLIGDVLRLADTSTDARYELGVVPHYTDANHPFMRDLATRPEVCFVDVSGTVEDYFNKLLSCRAVLSSSLHGLIFAEALGIPNLWVQLSDGLTGGSFKFEDWFSVAGQPQARPFHPQKRETTMALLRRCERHELQIDRQALATALPRSEVERLATVPPTRSRLHATTVCRVAPLIVFVVRPGLGPDLDEALAYLDRQTLSVRAIVLDSDPKARTDPAAPPVIRLEGAVEDCAAPEIDAAVQAFYRDWAEPTRHVVMDTSVDYQALPDDHLAKLVKRFSKLYNVQSLGPGLTLGQAFETLSRNEIDGVEVFEDEDSRWAYVPTPANRHFSLRRPASRWTSLEPAVELVHGDWRAWEQISSSVLAARTERHAQTDRYATGASDEERTTPLHADGETASGNEPDMSMNGTARHTFATQTADPMTSRHTEQMEDRERRLWDELARRSSDVRLQTEQISHLQRELSSLRAAHDAQLTQSIAQVERHAAQSQTFENALSSVRAAHAAQVQSLETGLQQLKGERDASEDRAQSLLAALNGAQAETARLSASGVDLREQSVALGDEVRSNAVALLRTENERDDALDRLLSLQQDHAGLQIERQDAATSLAVLEDDRRALTAQVMQMQEALQMMTVERKKAEDGRHEALTASTAHLLLVAETLRSMHYKVKTLTHSRERICEALGGVTPERNSSREKTSHRVPPEQIADSRLFDPSFYLRVNPDVAEAGMEPLTHYLDYGWREKRAPSPYLSVEFYASQTGMEAGSFEPIQHYLEAGAPASLNPNPLFDTGWYLRQNPEIRLLDRNPLDYYITDGASRGDETGPGMDAQWYLDRNPDVRASGMDALAHYFEFGWREMRDPHPLFDARFYAEANPEVREAGLEPLMHFRVWGWRQSRNPHPLISSDHYRTQRGEAVDEDPFSYFSRPDEFEAVDPSAAFDSDWYAQKYGAFIPTGWSPLLHYLRVGRAAGFSCRPTPGGARTAERSGGWIGDAAPPFWSLADFEANGSLLSVAAELANAAD